MSNSSSLSTQGKAFRERFFQLNPTAKSVIDLFRFLPSVYFYAKDTRHRYVGANQATLTHIFGLEKEDDLLGRTDADFQPSVLAQAYHAEDLRVMESRQTIPNRVWLVPHVRGTPQWFVSSKTPLLDVAEKVIGIAGVMYPIKTPQEQANYFQELLPVINFIDANFTSTISMSHMAEIAGLSTTHFNQRFKSILQMSPSAYVLSRRIQMALKLLVETDYSISDVGATVGFYDQSHFTRRFKKIMGMTPNAYRAEYR
ncbi:helix-turn-helix domain-containing protein [Mariniblastus fucicola]|uniref:Bifunctional transcriptional activator/DNA repair enzyme AdaA n=1 Tax=Mariniblastus fucicola TaxID=980251 RepID=A0A5B9PIL5_9BACT|nr:AraC family transcriptional regulator [Mariniblastus fucicola]QEG24526.1 Bifunctional transcriptional activator/DNA repair enzyme AdaA [Mariniblastus fucicola]